MERLTPMELQVMCAVYDACEAKESLSIYDVLEKVNGKYHVGWERATVYAYIRNLVLKNFLVKQRIIGGEVQYYPFFSVRDFRRNYLRDICMQVFDGDSDMLYELADEIRKE